MANTDGATITLIRGRNYAVVHPTDRRKGSTSFTRGKPIFVEDEAVIAACEAMVESVIDGDDEEIQKPMFLVERGDQTIEGRSAIARGVTKPARARSARRV